MKNFLFAALGVLASSSVAMALEPLPVSSYPAGTTPAQIAQHEAVRAVSQNPVWVRDPDARMRFAVQVSFETDEVNRR